MSKSLYTLILVTTLLTACGSNSHEHVETGIETHSARMNAAAQGENSDVFLSMHNHDAEADDLTSVTSEAADSVELHRGTDIVDTIPMLTDQDLDFSEDGYHIVLVSLKQELHVGDEIEIVLHFRDHEDITVNVPVQETADEHGHEEQSP